MTKARYISVTYAEPLTSFTSNVTRGPAPLSVGFTDTSNNTPTSWKWKFGDDATSTDQNPTHKYTEPGTYTVSLTAKNSAGSNTTKMTDYITVTLVGVPVVSFTADMRSGTIPFTIQFSDTSSNSPTSWLWSFGDGSSSTEKNPSHIYTAAGTYTVSLTATNEAGNNSHTASNYITANAVKTYTMGTTVPAADETAMTPDVTATVTAAQTTAPSAPAKSSFPYIIAGIIIVIVIGAGAVLYFRSTSRGGHGRGGGEL
jgi:PKD repeat protein